MLKSSSTPPAITASARPSMMSAAPRATARSPATVAWLRVTEVALASMAIPATAAMLFITVLGNVRGESPAALEPGLPDSRAAGGQGHAADAREPAHAVGVEQRHEARLLDLGREAARAP